MNVRIASATTIRSGVITSRTDACSRSRRMSCSSTSDATSPLTSASTSSSGSRRSRNARANGRAAASSCVSRPASLPSHQRAASGNDSSRSVSPVGAQSTTITSQRALLDVVADPQQAEQLVAAGRDGQLLGRDPLDPALDQHRAEPRLHGGPVALQLVLRGHLLRPQLLRDLGRARRRPAARARRPASAAGSVESTIVRCPAAAQRRAVAAATDVLPTPPLPV